MSRRFLAFIIALAILSLVGCQFKQKSASDYIWEETEIQKLLDNLSSAVLSTNTEEYLSYFSPDCPFLNQINEDFSSLKSNIKLDAFSMKLENVKPFNEGYIASVKIQWEGAVDGQKKKVLGVRDIYLRNDTSSWKIWDNNFHIYDKPSIVVGNGSLLMSDGQKMAKELSSKLLTDITHIQKNGDIILIGTAYDNASILELEKSGFTYVNVTDKFPKDDKGIVQVLSNIDNYRHIIIIQGNSLKNARYAVDFMAQYLKENKYIDPGVYFIKDGSMNKAEIMELTSLTSLDHRKTDEVLSGVKNIIEYNINQIKDEIALEEENIKLIGKNIFNPYKEDYWKAFSSINSLDQISPVINMAKICAYFGDEDICTKALELPPSYSLDFIYSLASITGDLKASPIIALLRLSGFNPDEVLLLESSKDSSLFINKEEGYSLGREIPFVGGISQQRAFDEVRRLFNDTYFIDFKENISNIPKEDLINSISSINRTYNLKKELLQGSISKRNFGSIEQIIDSQIPYSIFDMYEKLQNRASLYQSSSYSSLSEAREELTKVLGKLLSLKCKKSIASLAAKYGASQYDYSRYAIGFTYVEHPKAYAKAAAESKALKQTSWGNGAYKKDTKGKIQYIIDLLSKIKTEERAEDLFLQPETCLIEGKGGAKDKALLAYGIYSNMPNASDEAYIAIGDEYSYLVIKDKEYYYFIDCKWNTVVSRPLCPIYLCFNEETEYNSILGIGRKPSFLP